MKTWEYLNLALLVIIPMGCLVVVVWTVTICKLREYVPPARGEVLSATQERNGAWRLRVRWHTRIYAVVGTEHDWRHRRSGKPLRSRPMKGWLYSQWLELERLHALHVEIEPETVVDAIDVLDDVTDNVIRLPREA